MNKLFLSILYLAAVICVLTGLSCSVSTDASSLRIDDVEITEGPDGVKTIKTKKTTPTGRVSVVVGTGVSGNSGSVEYDDVYSQGRVDKRHRESATETRQVKNGWKDLNVSRGIEVDYTPAYSYSPVVITCEKWMLDYVVVKVNGTELEITTKNLNNNYYNGVKTKVKISGPPAKSITVSSAASVRVHGALNVQGKFSATLSNASSLSMQVLKVSYGDVTINLSSASSLQTFDITSTNNLALTASGASSLSVRGVLKAQAVAIDASGASSISVNQGCSSTSLSVGCVGASSTTINSFNGTWMDMEISGASSIKTSDVKCNKLVLVLNGASGATIQNFKGGTLDLSVNGTSEAKVFGINTTNVITTVAYGCQATLAGKTSKAHLSASNGVISADKLHAEKAHVDLTGDLGKINVKADKIFTDE